MKGVLPFGQLEAELRRLVRKYHARDAYVFGSYARGDAEADSDLDVLIEGGSSFAPTDIFAIAEELHLAFGKRVDVYELEKLDRGTAFYREVMKDRVLVA
ncbi:hypothetical protein B5F40_03435 [Gordonibacter sp. An230]|uniref:nucleotidyltransferase family protein n=1 Tax=Gordonibacter sp. An230 TaxID=1965592 RepID=UPI000B389350|nr:nucleotidyltransferase domain-containing protein [Gordonibacter sp. An230]OUO91499.1 hypothetical protein B5F40_03435 [Gordonibacter sp. An230]